MSSSQFPSKISLPGEMNYNLDYSMPPESKSYSVRIQPSNVNQITTSFTVGTAATTYWGDMQMPSCNIIFDIPCGASPSLFIDNRLTTLNFQMTTSITTAGGANGIFYNSYLRSGAHSWFDRMYIVGQNGNIIEDITEFGLLQDTLIALQMSPSVRQGSATQYGFLQSNALGNQGAQINILSAANNATATTQTETMSFSIPLCSGIIGVLADKFLNVGRTAKMQLVLQTTSTIPITGGVNTAFTTNGPTVQISLSNFSITCEYVDIGLSALQLLDQTLVDGKAYIHGTTYRTSSSSLPSNSQGGVSLLAGIRASSVKSIFTRFAQGTLTANNLHGKYNSFNPSINAIGFSIGGLKFPQQNLNPLLSPSSIYRETQIAIGSFNSTQFTSSIPPSLYCRLSAGGTGQALTVGNTQAYLWNAGADSSTALSQFIFGVCLETVAKRSLLSGLNCTSAPIFLEMNIANAPTALHNVYFIAMIDHVIIHDIRTGNIECRT